MADDSRQLLEVLRLPLAQLPHALQLPPPPAGSPVHVVITPPGSKSLSNRALLLAALSTGTSTLRGALLDADDAQRMLTALTQLGACINATDAASVRVTGVGGMWPTTGEILLNLNNAGTATRFLAGCATLARHAVTIDGNARMRERPIGELASVLRQLGCDVSFPLRDGYPPMRVEPAPLTAIAKEISVGTTQSSQFISAVLLAAAFLPGGVLLRSTGSLTSESYVRMSLGLLAHLGASVQCSEDLRVIRVRGSLECDVQGTRAASGLPAFTYDVEPDASGATYAWAAATLLPGTTCLTPALGKRSLQGDSLFPDMLARMGAHVERSIDEQGSDFTTVTGPHTLAPILADLSDMPDAAMTLASVACFATGTSVFHGLRTLRVKETDRVEAMRVELSKLGVRVVVGAQGDPDAVTITPPPAGLDCSTAVPAVVFDTYDDHRMAMALSLIALRRPNVIINDPQCVAKTYVNYWRDFACWWTA
ncbi:MAG: 3-phosphoshikimate 1-carboxyvinyltransferase [Phycisphaerae bacterium]|jgi:3-phosphoshikimate 1-carboxyvinyltransferase